MSALRVRIYRMEPCETERGRALRIVSLVNGACVGWVYADGFVREYGALPDDVRAAAVEWLRGKGEIEDAFPG